jgi:hypothetical protein
MRSRTATILMTFTAVALALSTMGEATPAYIWNASKSVPIGLYQLQPVGRLAVTELVAVRPTRAACDLSRSERLSADRRSHAQAGASATWADGLQERADDLGRWDRHGRSAVARQPRPSLARLAGMSLR